MELQSYGIFTQSKLYQFEAFFPVIVIFDIKF